VPSAIMERLIGDRTDRVGTGLWSEPFLAA
jgi:hypothetical protein